MYLFYFFIIIIWLQQYKLIKSQVSTCPGIHNLFPFNDLNLISNVKIKPVFPANKPLLFHKKEKLIYTNKNNNKLNVKASQDEINHIKKLSKRPNIHQGLTGSCHSFAFSDVFYAKSLLSISTSSLFLDWWFQPRNIIYKKEPKEDIFYRNKNSILNELNKIDKNNKNNINYKFYINAIDHLYDQGGYACTNLRLLQLDGGLLLKNIKKEFIQWNDIQDNLKDLYTIREKICLLYNDINQITDDDYSLWRIDFNNNGINKLILIFDNNRNDNTNKNEREYIKDVASEYVAKVILLERGNTINKLNQVIYHLEKGPLIGTIAYPNNNIIINHNEPSYHLHDVVVAAYSKLNHLFIIKDSASPNYYYHMKETDFLDCLVHLTTIDKNK